MATARSIPVEIPHLKKNQRIRDWRKLYVAATEGLTENQKKAYLRLYGGRDEGEKGIVDICAGKDTLKDALDEMELLIDGQPSRVELANEFFDAKPIATNFAGLTSFFFDILRSGKLANITNDLILMRYLKYIKRGIRFYEENEDKIKANMTEADLMALFKKLQAKLKAEVSDNNLTIKQEPMEESFVFQAEASTDCLEKRPKWAEDMLKDLVYVRERLEPTVEVYAGQSAGSRGGRQNFNSNHSNVKCYACNRMGHFARNCTVRCQACNGTGHNQSVCPNSKGARKPTYFPKKTNHQQQL